MNKVYCHTVYCHTTYDASSSYWLLRFSEGNWYEKRIETSEYYVVQHSTNASIHFFIEKIMGTNSLVFSDYFYTQEEYRDRKLNGLLNE